MSPPNSKPLAVVIKDVWPARCSRFQAVRPVSTLIASIVPKLTRLSVCVKRARALSGYVATYRVAVAAVPEPETWLMLVIGLGLAAYQLHRKQKSLGLQALRDESPSPA